MQLSARVSGDSIRVYTYVAIQQAVTFLMRYICLILILIALMASSCQASSAVTAEPGSQAPAANGSEISALDEAGQLLNSYTSDPAYPDDAFAVTALKEALTAAREGNYGFGACLVADNGTVVETGHNRVFYPYFRSDLHAEMDVLNRYEDKVRSASSKADGLTMYMTLEPSPMGLSRILVSGVKKVRYIAPDPEAGVQELISSMPPVWKEMAKGLDYAQAQCSPGLRDLASKIFLLSRQRLDERLKTPS
jgi:tRNA(adenine34) deaminase